MFSLLFFLFQCSAKNITDEEEIDKTQGILYVNLKYQEGSPTFDALVFTIENIDSLFQHKIEISKNTSKTILLPLKAGLYYFSDVTGNLNPDASDSSSDKFLHGKMPSNVFEIKPGRINYIGDIMIQIYLARLGKSFRMVSNEQGQQGLRKDLYFFPAYYKSRLESLKKNYPNLTKKYPAAIQKIVFGQTLGRIKEKLKKKDFYGYGKGSYGRDFEGYGDYKWGMTLEEVQKILDAKKRKYQLENDNSIIVDKTNKKMITQFYFSKLSEPQWKNRLFKVVLNVKIKAKKLKKLKKSIQKKYGSPHENPKKPVWTWEIPSTNIILVKLSDKKSKLIYLSKNHQKYQKLANTKNVKKKKP